MSKQDWERSHRRYEMIKQLAARPELLRDPAVLAEFGSREHAVRAMHQRWVTLVQGCLDVEIEIGTEADNAASLAKAVRRAVAYCPGLYEALAGLVHEPVLADLNQRFLIRLAGAVGVDTPGATKASVVREVRRIIMQAATVEATAPTDRRSWRPRHPFKWTVRPEAVELV